MMTSPQASAVQFQDCEHIDLPIEQQEYPSIPVGEVTEFTPEDVQSVRLLSPEMNDTLETAYWEFDARRKGYNMWRGNPQAERDAFKHVLAGLLNSRRKTDVAL